MEAGRLANRRASNEEPPQQFGVAGPQDDGSVEVYTGLVLRRKEKGQQHDSKGAREQSRDPFAISRWDSRGV